jgi:hypothetical protein
MNGKPKKKEKKKPQKKEKKKEHLPNSKMP